MRRTLVPSGSVAEEYVEYEWWDSGQALCSYVRGILCSRALLEASGVGVSDASAGLAAVAWALRDGLGMVASLMFSCFFGGELDGDPKKWRLVADCANDVGKASCLLDMRVP